MSTAALTSDQGAILRKIRAAFTDDLLRQDPMWEAYEVLASVDELDKVTIDTLRGLGPDYRAAADYQPHPSSGYRDGHELLADIRALQLEGVL